MSGPESDHASGSESAHPSGSEPDHAAGSSAKSATESDENDQAASFEEATSSESIPVPRNDDPTPVVSEPNRWYKMSVDEQCEKKDEESGGVERETTQLTVSITEVHRRSDDMFLEVGDCVVYEDVSEVGNGDESEARNGDEYQARNVSENGDGNESEARHGNDDEANGDDLVQDIVIDNKQFVFYLCFGFVLV
ncbi:S-antigen protein-like [Solanum tuberosum]|uniref:S-antigen protein-like n=1 Tax=Solanum tuberosum TaxID=4113 RepID=UPI00073A5100|nr:PREDICTED: S-antigen protein-like [Solanum tuberosum]